MHSVYVVLFVVMSDSLELGAEVGHKQCVQILSDICLEVDSYK